MKSYLTSLQILSYILKLKYYSLIICFQILEYNIPLGKKIRGITAVMTYETLTKSQQKPKEEMYLIHLMGWCIEIVILIYTY